jgi:predicted MFS family arabinose efflux permease
MTRTQAWRLVGYLAVALCLNNADRHAVFSIFPILKSKLHFTDLQLGLSASLFLWVYALCNPIAGQIGDRYSRKKLVALSLLLWSGITALTGLATSPWMLLGCRGLLGISESLFMPAAMALLASAHGPRTRSLATNVFGIGEYLGVVLGGSFGSLVAQQFHWRFTFLTLGILGAVYVIPYWGFLHGLREDDPPPVQEVGSSWSIASLVHLRSYWALCAAFPVCVSTVWLLYSWLPFFLYEKFSLTLAEAGFAATAYYQCSNLIGSLSGAVLADRLYARTKAARFWVAVAGFLFGAPCLFFIGHSSSLFMTKAAIVGFGLFGGLFLSNLMVASFDVVPSHTRASACGCMNLLGSMTSGFASLGEGKWESSVGIPSMMTLGALLSVAAALLLTVAARYFFPRDHQRARVEGAPDAQA